MKLSFNLALVSLACTVATAQRALYDEQGVLAFDNFGFEGYYKHVSKLDSSSSCSCELAANDKRTLFSGPNSPLDEEVSVHFRGPLSLSKFAYYVADNFTIGDDSGSDWNRLAYYNAAEATSENITFLTAAGDSSDCLGKALTYAGADGISSATESTVLANGTEIHSDEEFIIFSNISCEASGFKKDCGVYRDGIPAFHGFYGTTKLFLFEFTMPTESKANSSSYSYYDLPAIWLLNAHIPRTAQYPTNENCSCWATGCGEFDIFEVMNSTESSHLYTTIHDYQGIADIGTGIQAQGWIQREVGSTMIGGLVLDSQGTATVFVSNSTSIDELISAQDLNSWVSATVSTESEAELTLPSATNTGSGKVSAASPSLLFDLDLRFVYAAAGVVALMAFF